MSIEKLSNLLMVTQLLMDYQDLNSDSELLTVWQGLVSFFYKGQNGNYLGFAGHKVSVTTTQFCCYTKAAIDNP